MNQREIISSSNTLSFPAYLWVLVWRCVEVKGRTRWMALPCVIPRGLKLAVKQRNSYFPLAFACTNAFSGGVMPQQIQQTIFYLCICEMVKKCEIQNLDTRVKGRRGGVFLPRFRIHKMERFGALPGRISSRLHAFWYKGSGMWTPKRISVYRLLKHQFSVAHRIYFLGF